MIIEINGFNRDMLIENNKTYTKDEIMDIYNDVLKICREDKYDVADQIANKYGFSVRECSYTNKVDYCIDTDTDNIYKPSY